MYLSDYEMEDFVLIVAEYAADMILHNRKYDRDTASSYIEDRLDYVDDDMLDQFEKLVSICMNTRH